MPLPERSLIGQIRRMAAEGNHPRWRLGQRDTGVLVGIGDDCSVLRFQPSDEISTTDFSLEGVHFRRDWHSPDSVGHRCLARGLSDIAAMGGQPVAVFLCPAPHCPADVGTGILSRACSDLQRSTMRLWPVAIRRSPQPGSSPTSLLLAPFLNERR